MKRGLTIVIVVLIIVAAGVGLLWYVGSKSLTDKSNNGLGFIKITQKDTDNDGLSDSEETLWGTNPNNPDTNNDGIADGNSIQKNIDPAKAGSEPITGTDKRIQALAQNAITKKNAALIEISPADVPQSLTFKKSDLKITETETIASITKYRDDFRKALETYGSDIMGGEIESLSKFIDDGDESALIFLSSQETKYINLLKALSEITVPKSATELHLKALNSLSKETELLGLMTQIKSEPLLAIKSSQLFYEANNEFINNLRQLNTYFISRFI